MAKHPTPGRYVDLLVCGEHLGGTQTATDIYVHIDVHTATGGTIQAEDVRVWNGKRFAGHRKQVHVFDKRPMVYFDKRGK